MNQFWKTSNVTFQKYKKVFNGYGFQNSRHNLFSLLAESH